MCFTDAKKKEILVAADQQHKKADVLKMVAIAWRGLTDRERAYWDEQARDDKVRYVSTCIEGRLFAVLLKGLLANNSFLYFTLFTNTGLSTKRQHTRDRGSKRRGVKKSIQWLPSARKFNFIE